MGYWEKIGNKKSEQNQSSKEINRANANEQTWTCYSPLEDMWLLSSWTLSIWEPWWLLFLPLSILPPIDMIKLWCDLSLPIDINFQEGSFWIFVMMGLVLESQNKAASWMGCWSGTRFIEWSWIKKECRNKWQDVFPVVKSVTPSCMVRLYREDSVGPKASDRCDRVHYREDTCHLSSLGN